MEEKKIRISLTSNQVARVVACLRSERKRSEQSGLGFIAAALDGIINEIESKWKQQ